VIDIGWTVKSQLHSHALAIALARSFPASIMDGAVQFRKWLAIEWRPGRLIAAGAW
jgi:hypothetical protein